MSLGFHARAAVVFFATAGVLAPAGFATDATGEAALAARSLLLDAQAVGRAVIAVGANGHILRSADSGRTWEKAAVPTTATLTGVDFPDERNGWAVGHDALILHTADGGHTWMRQYQGGDIEHPYLDVCFLDAQTGFVVGSYGLFLATADGGQTWAARRITDEDLHFNRIAKSETGALFIAGEGGTLLRSDDRGATWRKLPSPYDGSFYGVLPIARTPVLAYGLRGRVHRSDDKGETWDGAAAIQPALLATAIRLRGGAIVLAGQARAFWVSRDDGRTFAPWAAGLTTPVAELVETADGRLLAFGEAGVTVLPGLGPP
ncbi:MAG: hypothetical protein A3G75_06905 [Verrucomicrobia bacterium RIFCSPLOWO2_12_FULL_64_8]|nr:MAG: hypothetical protein A3G75_06905 [Verrucomicrobia bacterium RIFCSPLOWO2_12_FULL_64_8]